MQKSMFTRAAVLAVLAALAASTAANAADWSDTSLSYRYGTNFAEPFGRNDITKNILNLSHASGYKYGSNFFSADMLLSDKNDPAAPGSSNGAHEVYVVYRHTLDIGKVTGRDFKYGPTRGLGATLGFDLNTKSDAGYNSKKRMLVAGPTIFFDVPGFLNVSLLALWESNAPHNSFTNTDVPRYRYKTHPMLSAAWAIPFSAGIPLSFEGYANFIAAKGRDEFGGSTAPETNIDAQIMYDVSPFIGAGKNTFRVGLEYQYWRNKFGNPYYGAAGSGAFAHTPMVRVEYHF
ncbi:Nucleoside-specific outer membrane channel protein Tsx [Noviherbaspirillum humi]|uniref:Nucleoside-specific outer membrane channel protein Tsx n=1 Tax=Noviherbaspirillum humi TaxID=1688639 RepID=A0A239HTY3_9BURK|nr:outer envelope protein [Noviherbaspirillum humi]SNS84850.1 Nucleoside-specific outer membrane channel protein Tsx [Noviherbaspirillum humi]